MHIIHIKNTNNENKNNKNNKNYKNKKIRLYLSHIQTFFSFLAIILQYLKYYTENKAIVSGWSKLINNIICGTIMVYLKCSSYDIELNNKYHTTIFFIKRIILIIGFGFLIYTDYHNDFESFSF